MLDARWPFNVHHISLIANYNKLKHYHHHSATCHDTYGTPLVALRAIFLVALRGIFLVALGALFVVALRALFVVALRAIFVVVVKH